MKLRNLALVFSLSAMGLLAQPARSAAQELIEFSAPDAGTEYSSACAPYCGTTAFGNNDLGVIVGTYTDPNIVPYAFIRTPEGKIIPFQAPGAGLGYGLDQGTVAYNINDVGVIVGQFQDSSYVYHGYIRYADGTFATFDATGGGYGRFPGHSSWLHQSGRNNCRILLRREQQFARFCAFAQWRHYDL